MELTKENIPQYFREHQSDIDFFDYNTDIDSVEIGDGNLNFVYRVYDTTRPDYSLVLKQAPPYIKILGPDYPLPPERLTFEYQALMTYNEFASETVPKLYFFDVDSAVIIMEDLQGYRLLRDDLIRGQVNTSIPVEIGRFLGIIHSQTYFENLDIRAIKQYKLDFKNTVMQSITSDYVFTFPFTEHETNFYSDGLKEEVDQLKTDKLFIQQTHALKRKFLNVQQGLTHGDLHTGSIMVRDQSTKVIDSEFAFFGPVGFDVGLFWANYLLSYYSHSGNIDVQSKIKSCVVETWDSYIEEFKIEQHIKDVTLRNIFHEAVGFTGMEMLRRIIGAAHVKDIEGITDKQRKLEIEIAILKFGKKIVKEHHNISSAKELVELL
ncbi:S-methyl-5-thioribose kinase [Candidatus Poribacteria bacterium]|nr:MAG: S-methyl-5-thioribose kinase [Candidatus Poribacteria bacterium]